MAVITTAQAGNASNPATWTGGVLPADGDYVEQNHDVVLDTSFGTQSTGLGMKRWIVGKTAACTLTRDTVTNRTFIFGGNGVSAIGTGSTTAPGNDADYHGFYVGKGTLDLSGTSGAVLTIDTAESNGFFYIAHPFNAYSSATLVCPITLSYCNLNNLGQAVTNFEGIHVTLTTTGTSIGPINVNHCIFNNPYRIFRPTGTHATIEESVTYQFNTIIGGRADFTFYNSLFANPNRNWTLEDNTFYDYTYSAGTGAAVYFIGDFAAGAKGLVFKRNALLTKSTQTVKRDLLRTGGLGPEPTSSATLEDNIYLCDLRVGGVGSVADMSSSGTVTASGLISEGGGHGYRTSYAGSGVTMISNVSNCFFTAFDDSTLGQGMVFNSVGYGTYTNCIGVLYTSAGNLGFFAYTGGGKYSGMNVNHCTLVGPYPGDTSGSSGIDYGEASAGLASDDNKGHSNIVANYRYGFVDDTATGDNTYTVDTPPGAGIHHNLTFGCLEGYHPDGIYGTGWTNGVDAHPHANYGDLDGINPQFVDSTRNSAAYDLAQGGPGTNTHVITELGKRVGHTLGTFNPAYAVATIRAWIFAGYKPQNTALRGTAYVGTDFGAVPLDAAPVSSTTNHRSNWLRMSPVRVRLGARRRAR